MELTYDPKIPVFGIYPKALKVRSQRDILYAYAHSTLFTITKRKKQSKYPSIREWIKKIQ